MAMPVPACMPLLACTQWHMALDPDAQLLEVVLQVADCLQKAIPVAQWPYAQILLQQAATKSLRPPASSTDSALPH